MHLFCLIKPIIQNLIVYINTISVIKLKMNYLLIIIYVTYKSEYNLLLIALPRFIIRMTFKSGSVFSVFTLTKIWSLFPRNSVIRSYFDVIFYPVF